MKSIIKTNNAPAPIGPYNQAILSGNMLFISGQIAINPENEDAGFPMNTLATVANVISPPIQLASDGINKIFGPISGSAINLSNISGLWYNHIIFGWPMLPSHSYNSI